MPATSPGLIGVCTQKQARYLNQGQTQIKFNYKHSCKSYFYPFQ